MKEIKFRIWDKWSKNMFFWDDLSEHYIPCNYKECFELLQYTGLKDKNGEEIYKGDIVAQFCFNDPRFRHEVKYFNGAFGYVLLEVFHAYSSNEHFNWVDGKSERIEIIGNIYENPELLKESEAEK